MAGPGPWSVKGVDDETRAIARAAAGQAGLPIGAWIDRAILKATGASPTPSDKAVANGPIMGTTDQAGPDGPAAAVMAPGGSIPSATEPEPSAEEPVAADSEPGRPVASPLDAVSRSGERAVRPTTSSVRLSEASRLGLGGVAALAVVVLAITVVDRLIFAPRPFGAATEQTAADARPATEPPPAEDARLAAPAEPQPPSPGRAANALPSPDLPDDPRVAALTARASAGDVAAQHDLALAYRQGEGVARNPALAAAWFEKAAAQGSAVAQFNLGKLYEEGRGVQRDPALAFSWYRKAAEQGHIPAQHDLGALYATGTGVAQNYEEAARWFGRAAEAGNPASLYSLGLMHEHGLGLTRDPAAARRYYERAAVAGSADATTKLATLAPPPAPSVAGAGAPAEGTISVAPAAGPPAEQAVATPGSDRPLDRRGTAELQRLLARLDFAPGAPDGVAGRRTVAAIKLYQEFAGFHVDGKPTQGLLDDLRQVARSLGREPRAPRR